MKNTLVQLLYDSVQRVPEKDAVVHGENHLSYQALWEKACGIAHYLINHGLKPGDRVALLLDNSPEYIAAYYGVLMTSGAVIGLNTAAKSRDLANWIEHSQSAFVFANSKHPELKKVLKLIKQQNINLLLIGSTEIDLKSDKWTDIKEQPTLPDTTMEFDPKNQLASIIYTSGTTGHPKGVMLSHSNLYHNIKSILTYLELNENDSIVNVLPFYYSYGNSVLHIHLAVGATLILENSMLYPQKVVSLMADKKVTGFSGVPSTFNLLLSRTRLGGFDLSSIRYMTQAGGPMAPANIERLKNELPNVQFYVMYGQTEASARLSYLPPNKLTTKLGSIGIAIPGVELEVMDSTHSPADPNVTGEIYARGENIMLGYWKDPEATQQVMHNNWLKTGDLAYKDEDNYLYIVGRSSEMIKSGAHRISPKDIEEVILELDGIEETAVVGITDDLLGQAIKAVIVKSPESNLDKMQVMRHCKTNLANYKLPKQIEFTDEIPRTASGKVRRFMLQE
ncbi:MAG: acyl--CoA ligase [Gammaproteobacteria bacterium]|nr:acyl--CoA ligase [Gammaproteobacteria bacterium]